MISGATGTQSDSNRAKSPLARKKRNKKNLNSIGGIVCPEVSMKNKRRKEKGYA